MRFARPARTRAAPRSDAADRPRGITKRHCYGRCVISRPQRDVGRSHPENANRCAQSRALAHRLSGRKRTRLVDQATVLERRLRGGRSGGDVARRGWAVMTTELRGIDFGSAGGGSSNMWHQESILVAADAAAHAAFHASLSSQGRSMAALVEDWPNRGAEAPAIHPVRR